MKRRGILAAGICVLLVGGATLAACGSKESSTTPKPSASISAREAAKRYFAAMAPVVDQDYRASKQFKAAGAQWKREYQTIGPSSLTVWQDFAGVLMSFVPRARQILAGYEAIQPPPAFRKAHAALIADDEAGLAAVEEIVHDINTLHAPPQWAIAIRQLGKGPAMDRRVAREFRKAAAKLHLRVPPKLLKVYSP